MDLRDLTPKSDIVEVNLKHPTTGEPLTNGDGTQMTISVYGPYSKNYKEALYGKTQGKIKDGATDLSVVELEDLNLTIFAAATNSWNITFDGEQPELTEEAALKVYREVYWIKQQIDEAVSQALDFTTA